MNKIRSLIHMVNILNSEFLKNAAFNSWVKTANLEVSFLSAVERQLSKRVIISLAAEHDLVLKRNLDLNEGFTQIVDSFRTKMEKRLKEVMDARDGTVEQRGQPIDSYCGSKKNIQYWEQLLDGEDDEAVKDFVKYVKQVKCK